MWDWGNSAWKGSSVKNWEMGDPGHSQGLVELEQPLGKEIHLGLRISNLANVVLKAETLRLDFRNLLRS